MKKDLRFLTGLSGKNSGENGGSEKTVEGQKPKEGEGKRKADEGAETREGVFYIMAAIRRPGGGGRRRSP